MVTEGCDQGSLHGGGTVKVGDLVRIDPSYLREDESKIALITLYPDDEGYIFQE